MEKKYEFTEEVLEYDGCLLHRIKALIDFGNGNVKPGDLGGWIESENNLSQYGYCWVYDNAKVYEKAQVFGNAWVCNDAKVYEKAQVFGNAWVCNDAKVYEKAQVYGNAKVGDNAKVYGDAMVYENAWVCGSARVFDHAWVYGNAEVFGDAEVKGMTDYMVFKNTWSSGRYFTWTRSNNRWKVGCFYGTDKELIKKAYADSYEKGKCYEATVKYVKTINRINSSDDGNITITI